MKHIKNLNQFINERVEYDSIYINGEKVTSSWSGFADNESDFIKMINEMPETLESIKVTSSTSAFNPSSEKFEGPINKSKKNKIIKIVKDMTKAFKEGGDEITLYELGSYSGPAGKNHDSHPAYIQYRSKKIDQFGKGMSSGRFGSLD